MRCLQAAQGRRCANRYMAHLEANARAYSVPAVPIAQGLPDNGRSAQAREDMRNNAAVAREWVHGDRTKRVTTAGPVLSAYGQVGASGYTEVARCTIDVSLVVTDSATRKKFVRMCYKLLPSQHSEIIYELSRRITINNPAR